MVVLAEQKGTAQQQRGPSRSAVLNVNDVISRLRVLPIHGVLQTRQQQSHGGVLAEKDNKKPTNHPVAVIKSSSRDFFVLVFCSCRFWWPTSSLPLHPESAWWCTAVSFLRGRRLVKILPLFCKSLLFR